MHYNSEVPLFRWQTPFYIQHNTTQHNTTQHNTTQHKPYKDTPILTQQFGSWRSRASQILHESELSIQPTIYCICMYVHIL